MCTRRRATVTCLSVFVASVFLYGATPFAAEVRYTEHDQYRVCSEKPAFRKFMQVFTYIDSLLTLLVPLIAISCMLVGLVLSIFHASRWKKRMGGLALVMRAPTPPPRYKKSQTSAAKNTSTEQASGDSVPLRTGGFINGSMHAHEHEQTQESSSVTYTCRYHHGNSRHQFGKTHKKHAVSAHQNHKSASASSAKRGAHRPKNAQVRVTRMLFALSVSYVVMNAPSHVTRLYFLIRTVNVLGEGEGCQLTYREGLINLALQYVTYAHSAGKFWIFLLFSKNFTKSLTMLFKESFLCRRPCSKM
ncbi:CapaR_0 protein [Elysia marginata]|uniref:CapaR_0 protein n=1 Tax=Elysia marginata TaxID=1093978 RepID=A0AAV4HA35_9GAST|nr:CapaR_0 protein [Elysia marginata]